MSLEDPFFVVKDEVHKAVQNAKALYQRWCELLSDPNNCTREEYDWTTNELRNSLRSIEWDLEDLEETISIVEKNTKKFKIDDVELSDRRAFVDRTKATVKHYTNKRTGLAVEPVQWCQRLTRRHDIECIVLCGQ